MPPTALQHRRTHNLLLINKLLNQRDAGSPFTLVLDNLEQSAKPLVAEYAYRAKVRASDDIDAADADEKCFQTAGVNVIFVGFQTIRKPRFVDNFVSTWDQSPQAWHTKLAEILKAQSQQQREPSARF
jgi:elongator complex protein 5